MRTTRGPIASPIANNHVADPYINPNDRRAVPPASTLGNIRPPTIEDPGYGRSLVRSSAIRIELKFLPEYHT